MKTVYKCKNFDIVTEDEKITYVGKTNEEGIHLSGDIFPGLIDTHSHGCLGYDTMDGKYLHEMSVFQAQNGVTSWLPTTMTMDTETIAKVVNPPLPHFDDGANVLGYHMEGPYISEKYKGAQNEKFIKAPDIEEYKGYNNIKIVTIAPELEGSIEFIKNCPNVVSLGHTAAGYDISAEAIDAGAMCLTHTFNAMSPLHHREPGPIGAAAEKNIYVQVISDGVHLHKSIVMALYKIFGADRMVLISDSMRATGMPDGEYEFGGQRILVNDKKARTEDGALAGSTSTLFDCVKKAIEFGIPKEDVFRMASSAPAELLKLNKGKIEKGYDADFIAVDDKLEITAVVIGGKKII